MTEQQATDFIKAYEPFATDIQQFCPEWNDKEIAGKKAELSFAYLLNKTEDIQRLESEIKALTEQLHASVSHCKDRQETEVCKQMMRDDVQGVPAMEEQQNGT